MAIRNSLYKFMPHNLVSRFLLIIAVPMIIAQLVAIYIFYDRHWSNVFTSTSKMVANEINLITNVYNNHGFEEANAEAAALGLRLRYTPGMKLERQSSVGDLEGLAEALKSITKRKVALKLVKDETEIQIMLQLPKGVLTFHRSVKPLINPTTYVFVVWMVSLTFLLFIVSLIFSRNQIRSILELARAADSFGSEGKEIIDYKPSGATEIRKAGIAFLRMKERIEQHIAKRTQMLAMISHDLKTPLTRMKLQLEMMPNSEEVEDMRGDVVSMQQMISSYLDFARGEEGEGFEQVKILDWFQNRLNISSYVNLDISYGKNSQNPYIAIKPHAFQRAIDNILGNANKYAAKLIISTAIEENELIIDIEDNGSGISDSQKELVFSPFYRGDSARNIEAHGSVGLGLSITREIILGHNGSIRMMDGELLGGLRVRIVLKVIPA